MLCAESYFMLYLYYVSIWDFTAQVEKVVGHKRQSSVVADIVLALVTFKKLK